MSGKILEITIFWRIAPIKIVKDNTIKYLNKSSLLKKIKNIIFKESRGNALS